MKICPKTKNVLTDSNSFVVSETSNQYDVPVGSYHISLLESVGENIDIEAIVRESQDHEVEVERLEKSNELIHEQVCFARDLVVSLLNKITEYESDGKLAQSRANELRQIVEDCYFEL